jgi:hypothetical protein
VETRRYYRKGVKYPYTVTEEEYDQYVNTGEVDIEALDNAETEILLTPDEQVAWYGDCLLRVEKEIEYYLHNLDCCPEFRVGWNNYSKRYEKKKCRVCGKEYPGKSDVTVCCKREDFKLVHYGVGRVK